ncbi:MAG: ABC transporter ATP-binding protein [Candidatus Ancaeobacter aquaticus]|nr:ABC transporter ATP-binding protein [Candidatus Ancaeobacter aquaticus]
MSKSVVSFSKVNFLYHDGTKALQDVSFNLYENETLGVIGPNGAGKSTMLLHMNGILQGTGEVSICGMKVSEKNKSRIRKKVGLVFQDPDSQLFMPTVFDDVSFGPLNMGLNKDDVIQSVHMALREVTMESAIDRPSHHLSFGEKKRVSIATVLSMSPDVLVLDEPASNLDPRSRRELITLLNNFKHTKIIASHDLEMIRQVCNRVILLDNGCIISDGNSDAIMRNEELMISHGLEVPYSLRNNVT